MFIKQDFSKWELRNPGIFHLMALSLYNVAFEVIVKEKYM